MNDGNSAKALVEQLGLEPHPEGGWYRETWRAPSRGRGGEGRAPVTAILFLLLTGEHSHWHRVDADDLWLWHRGDPLELRIADGDEGPVRSVVLGADIAGGEKPQALVEANAWQAARLAPLSPEGAPGHGFALMSCVVVPGFDFAGFTLAPPGWEPGTPAPSRGSPA